MNRNGRPECSIELLASTAARHVQVVKSVALFLKPHSHGILTFLFRLWERIDETFLVYHESVHADPRLEYFAHLMWRTAKSDVIDDLG